MRRHAPRPHRGFDLVRHRANANLLHTPRLQNGYGLVPCDTPGGGVVCAIAAVPAKRTAAPIKTFSCLCLLNDIDDTLRHECCPQIERPLQPSIAEW